MWLADDYDIYDIESDLPDSDSALSYQKKKEFIEQLAEPYPEKMVFYRWLHKSDRERLLTAGEMTPEIHKGFMMRRGLTGSGIYVSVDLHSFAMFGETLIQVEVEPGYKYLDISNETVLKKLREKGISFKDLVKVKAEVAIRDVKDGPKSWWVIRGKEGIKFNPFNGRGMNLKYLEKSYQEIKEYKPERGRYFLGLVEEDILNRAEKDISVFRSSFVKVVEEARGKNYVQGVVNRYSRHISTFKEGMNWLKNAEEYMSESNRKAVQAETKRLFDAADELLMQTLDDQIDLLRYTNQYGSENDKKKVVENIPVKSMSMEERIKFLKRTGEYLWETGREEVVKNIPIHFMKEGVDFLHEASEYLSEKEKAIIANKIANAPFKTLSEGLDAVQMATRFSTGDFSDSGRTKIIEKFKNVPIEMKTADYLSIMAKYHSVDELTEIVGKISLLIVQRMERPF